MRRVGKEASAPGRAAAAALGYTEPMRELCARCRRPQRVCYCVELSPASTKTRVVLLQHPRERRVAIGTARIAHLGLANSELHVGVDFSRNARVNAVAAGEAGRVAILYPTPDALPAEEFKGKLDTLIVVDGTWNTARKLFEKNPPLATLPRVRLTPTKPGNYRIRKEPAEHCLATVEAVAEVLSTLEGDSTRFEPMLRAFERMVDLQLDHQHTRTGPSRHANKRKKVSPRRFWFHQELESSWERAVVVYAEANAPSFKAEHTFTPELIHLAAVKPATGERFEAIVRPQHPLANIPYHIGVPHQVLLDGEALPSALERFDRFVAGGPLLIWGGFVQELLQLSGDLHRPCVDLRLLACRRLNRNAGGPDNATLRMGGSLSAPWARGRAGLRVAAMEDAARLLRIPAPVGQPITLQAVAS